MWLAFKELAAFVVSSVAALLVFFGGLPFSAHAPEVTVPAPVQVEEEIVAPEVAPSTEPAEPVDSADDVPKESTTTPLEEVLNSLQAPQPNPAASPVATEALNEVVRSAVVNILCTTLGSGPINPISASGVVIDPRGIILTNAHVAQYLLLKDYPAPGFVECVARTGSPATPAYRLELLFIPPSWVVKNAEKIDDERPTGNGEHDYALLHVVETLRAELPDPLPHLPLVSDSPLPGASVLLAGYPAGFLGGAIIAKELYAASTNARVGEVYTYNASTIDLFSIGGSILAQQGSSGGAVAVANSESTSGAALLGLIVTSSDGPDTASRDLRALSTEYIVRDFALERGIPFTDFLAREPQDEAARFTTTSLPTLSALLIRALTQ